jgi:hypothetical protein
LIVFQTHALQALAYSASRTAKNIEHLHSIFVSTYAVLFLGTPHNGSNKTKLAMIGQHMLNALMPSKIWDTDDQLLNTLEEGSETLQNITDQFAPLMRYFCIYFFWEQEKTDLKVKKDYVCVLPTDLDKASQSSPSQRSNRSKVVDEASAAPILDNTERCGIPASHSQMCKFDDGRCMAYKTIVSALMRYERAAPAVISARWVQAKEMLLTLRRNEASEMTKVSWAMPVRG